MSKSSEFENWIFNSFSTSPEGLGLYRIFSAVLILLFLMPPVDMYSFLGSLPNDFFVPPPGLMQIFSGFPPEWVFFSLHSALFIALISLLVGFKTRIASLTTGILILLLKGFFYSVGKINHDLLMAVVPIVMAFSGWGSRYSIDAYYSSKNVQDQNVKSWPFTLLALIIGFMMFTAGFPKILGGWLDVHTQATYGHFLKQYFVNGRQDLLADQAIEMNNVYIWESLDYLTILFETGFLLAIVHPRTTRLFVSLAVIFHFSVMMLLNIPFLHNFVAYAAFLNWSHVNTKIKSWLNIKFSPVLLLTAVFSLLWILVQAAEQLQFPELHSDLKVSHFYLLLFALPIAIWYLTYFIKSTIKNMNQKRTVSK